GLYRKVGPSLRRLSEKTNPEWTRKWLNSPRGFRADTRMPHFYNLSNNSEDVLPTDQKKFPGTEMHCLTAYLFEESKRNLEGKDTVREMLVGEQGKLLMKLTQQIVEANGEESRIVGPLNEKDRKDLDSIPRQLTDLGLLSVPSKAADINRVAAELKQ